MDELFDIDLTELLGLAADAAATDVDPVDLTADLVVPAMESGGSAADMISSVEVMQTELGSGAVPTPEPGAPPPGEPADILDPYLYRLVEESDLPAAGGVVLPSPFAPGYWA